MNQVKETMTGFFIGLAAYTVLVEIFGILFSSDIVSFSLGLLVGVATCVFLFCHMTKTLDYSLDMEQGAASKYTTFQSILRLLVMFAVLTIGMKLDRVNFVAVVLGLFGLKVAALIAPTILRKLYPDDFITKPEDMVMQEDEDDLDEAE